MDCLSLVWMFDWTINKLLFPDIVLWPSLVLVKALCSLNRAWKQPKFRFLSSPKIIKKTYLPLYLNVWWVSSTVGSESGKICLLPVEYKTYPGSLQFALLNHFRDRPGSGWSMRGIKTRVARQVDEKLWMLRCEMWNYAKQGDRFLCCCLHLIPGMKSVTASPLHRILFPLISLVQ